MASALKTWRQSRREAQFWQKAQARSVSLAKGEVVNSIDLTLMSAGQAISRYRTLVDPEMKTDQLFELRMQLEAALGMLDNLL